MQVVNSILFFYVVCFGIYMLIKPNIFLYMCFVVNEPYLCISLKGFQFGTLPLVFLSAPKLLCEKFSMIKILGFKVL
jgi:hypothetical protein